MARQKEDKFTVGLPGVAKISGRPATGKAISPAKKQAAYRARLKQQGIASVSLTPTETRFLLGLLNQIQPFDIDFEFSIALMAKLRCLVTK